MLFPFTRSKPLFPRPNPRGPPPLIICPRRTKHRVLMRPDYHDLRPIPRNFRLDIVAPLSAHLVGVPSGPQSGSRKGIFDEIGSGIELWVMPHVALADFSGQLLHIRAELFA